MGRLDPAESGEEGGGTLEGEGTSFYFHQGQTPPDIIYPCTRIQWGWNRYSAARPGTYYRDYQREFIRILEILRRHPPLLPLLPASLPSLFLAPLIRARLP